MMGIQSKIAAGLAKFFGHSGAAASKTTGRFTQVVFDNAGNVVKDAGKVIGNAGSTVARTAVDWGKAVKIAFASGGVVGGIYLINGGAVDLISRIFGTSASESQFLLIAGCAIVLLFVLKYIFNRIGSSQRRSMVSSVRNLNRSSTRSYNSKRYKR